MNSGVTSGRVYDALKRRILSSEIAPGEKLEPAAFADELGSSITPVRDALHRLAGERLVETRASEGFHLPLVTEPGLRDRYTWNGQLTRLIVNAWPRGPTSVRADESPADVARASRSLFEAIGDRADNQVHADQLRSANDLLAAPRVVEAKVLPDTEAEVRAIAVAFDNDDPGSLLKLLAGYHRRRVQATAAIVRALYRT